jgi:hypothetical protein
MWDMGEEREECSKERGEKELEEQAKYKRRPAVVFKFFLRTLDGAPDMQYQQNHHRSKAFFEENSSLFISMGYLLIVNPTVLIRFPP